MGANKGSWSEFYVFLKLLADGKLYAADENLNANESLFYIILKLIKTIARERQIYKRNGSIKIYSGTDKLLSEISLSDIKKYPDIILNGIVNAPTGKRSFDIQEANKIFKTLLFTKVSDNTKGKGDITVVIHDPVTVDEKNLTFSIKSYLGSNPTLFNAGKSTNIIYKINGDLSKKDVDNLINLNSYTERVNYIFENGFKLNYIDYSGNIFKSNLVLIDSLLPEILANMLLYKYIDGINSMTELLNKLKNDNPCNYNLAHDHKFYEYKIKRLLVDSALGMTGAKVWDGLYNATGGFIIVKKTGELVCFHIYNWNDFQNYLINKTKLESPDSSPNRCDFGRLLTAKEVGLKSGYYIKLNFQIRFR